MRNKADKDIEVAIATSVLKEIPDSKLLAAKKFFDNLSDHKRITKLYNTYIEGVEIALGNTQNGRMYVNYNLDGAVTGRLSNSGGNLKKGGGKEHKIGVSFHTLPREQEDFNIREYIKAPDGWNFITIDYSGMELRILAHVANERNMIRAFESGEDLHDFSTKMTFNKDKDKTDPHEWKKLRQICKEVSFLTIYGGTAFTLANKRNISEAKADKIINTWLDTYPGVRQYMKTVDDYINQFKYAKTIFGRYRHLPNIDSPIKSVKREAFRQGLNFTIQSPASDILLCGLIGIHKELKKLGLKGKLVGTVHDSIEVVCPPEETDTIVGLVYNQLINYPYLKENFNINLRVPLAIEVEVGTSFGNGKKYDLARFVV